MSRHQAFRNYDYENDLDEYEGGEYLDEEEEGDELSPEDRAQMAAATSEVKSALGPQASKVSTAQIQEALWHYYYDVDKSVAYLVNKFIDPAPPKQASAKAAKKGSESTYSWYFLVSSDPAITGAAEADPWSVPSGLGNLSTCSETDAILAGPFLETSCLGNSSGYGWGTKLPKPPTSYAAFFHDMPWMNIPRYRETVFLEPQRPKGGLLGGSGAPPKMSKLQALAAARKKKGEEKKSEDKAKEPNQESATESLKDTTNRPTENSKSLVMGLSKRRKLESSSSSEDARIHTPGPSISDHPVSYDVPQQPKSPQIVMEDALPPSEPAKPSAFAQTLLGSDSAAPRARLQFFSPPYMALNMAISDAFAKPSPDDAVLAAQSQGSRFANGGK